MFSSKMSEPMETCSSGAMASTSNTESLHYIPRKLKKNKITLDLDKLKQDSKFHVTNNVGDFELELERENVLEARSLKDAREQENSIDEFFDENGSPVHVVISDENGEGSVCWYKTLGDCSSLRAHLVQRVEKVVEDKELITELENCEGKVVTISGEFAMGKSTTLRWLMKTLQSNYPDKEIVQIDLANHKDKNFVKKLNNLTLLKVEDSSKTIVLFDSFDEIGLKHQHKIFKIFKKLLHKRVHLLLVGCQKHREFDLVKYSSKNFRLEPLSGNELTNHLSKDGIKKGMFYQVISNRADEFQTPLLVAKLVQLAKTQPNKHGLINSPEIFKAFKAIYDYYTDQYTIKILQIDPSRNFSTSERRSQKKGMFRDLGLYNTYRLLGMQMKSVLRKSDWQRVKDISKEKSTVQNLLTFCPDLDHSSFREFFVAYFLYSMYVDLEDFSKFWDFFENVLKAEDLVNVFFFQMLSTRFEKSRSLIPEDHTRFNVLLQKLHKYSEEEQLNFVMGRNLTGCLTLLLQNNYTIKLPMVQTVLENDFFEIIDYFHRNDILLTKQEWTISVIASFFKCFKTINHLEEKFPNFKCNRADSETTIKIHSTRRKLEELQLTSAVSSQEFLIEDIQRAKRARLRANQSKSTKNECQDEEMSGPSVGTT